MANSINFIIPHNSEETYIFSPNSIFSLFSPLFEIFDEGTKDFLRSIFQCELTEIETGKSFDLYHGELKKKTKLILRKECELKSECKNNIQTSFGCDVAELGDEQYVPSSLNRIMENTNDCALLNLPGIENFVNFNMQWLNNFQINENTMGNFYKMNGDTVQTNFMNQEIICGYLDSAEIDAKILELPFCNKNLSMLVIVPKNETGMSAVEANLSNYSLEQLLSGMKKSLTKVFIPKFKDSSTINLENIFKTLGFEMPPFKLGTSPSSSSGVMLTKSCIEISEFDCKATALSACQIILDSIVKEMLYETTIANRFAKTRIMNKVKNVENMPQESIFSMVLPKNAFILEFVMVIKGKSYKSYVKETEEAKLIYDQAVAKGRSAAHVATSARDSNKFTVSVNVEPNSEATFLLTYEELLQRRYDQYEFILNVNPRQLVSVLKVLINIDESRKLKYVRTPAIRSGNEINDDSAYSNEFTNIEVSDSQATVTFEPDLEMQKQIARQHKKSELTGFSGQFVLQYDVELDPDNGEIFINDGYFVHFYAPDNLPALAKHVIFSLDTSGSMGGRKIVQLKEAMKCILDQIQENDLVDILQFSTNVTVYNIDTQTPTVINYEEEENYFEPFYKYDELKLSTAKPANKVIIKKAKSVVNKLQATSKTHVIAGLETALYLAKLGKEKYPNYQPIIIFLTDGFPNVGIYDTSSITEIVTKLNEQNNKSPIFTLSFGGRADKNFLRKLSLRNFGFSRHIYEASDASLQLQQFYKQISCPLLSNVTFKYASDVEDVTRVNFPTYFRGSDIIVCGKYTDSPKLTFINMNYIDNCVKLTPIIKESNTSLERLWAYLTIKQLLEQREFAENKTDITRKAVDLALKYSFVTEVTSLVIVKSEEFQEINAEAYFEDIQFGDTQKRPRSSFRFHRPYTCARNKFFASNRCRISSYACNVQYVLELKSQIPRCQHTLLNSRGKHTANKCVRWIARSFARVQRSCFGHNRRQSPVNEDRLIANNGSGCHQNDSQQKQEKNDSNPIEFKADRPFIIMIKANLENKTFILFTARICEPVFNEK